MMDIDEIALALYDDLDIHDVLRIIEKSFAFRFDPLAFQHVRTFGDLCGVIESELNREQADGCTRQQAFYRIRGAISETLDVDKAEILLDSRLEDLFPIQERIKRVRIFQKKLGIKLLFLTTPGWVGMVCATSIVLSFLTLFFKWKIAVLAILFFIAAWKLAGRWGKDLEVRTVRDLTEKLTREHYAAVRRDAQTINRAEIAGIVRKIFIEGLVLDDEPGA